MMALQMQKPRINGVSAEDVYEQSRHVWRQKRDCSHPPTHAFEHKSREGHY